MQIPQNQNLHSQNFNSKFIEFVWWFDNIQFIFKVNKDHSAYIETGDIDDSGDWCGYGLQEFPNPTTLNYGKYDDIKFYPYFTDNELSTLRDDVVKYLNEP